MMKWLLLAAWAATLAACGDDPYAGRREELEAYYKRRDAYMRECIVHDSEKRCLELWRWVHSNDH